MEYYYLASLYESYIQLSSFSLLKTRPSVIQISVSSFKKQRQYSSHKRLRIKSDPRVVRGKSFIVFLYNYY